MSVERRVSDAAPVEESEDVGEGGVQEMVRVERGGEVVGLYTLHHHQIHETGHAHQRNID